MVIPILVFGGKARFSRCCLIIVGNFWAASTCCGQLATQTEFLLRGMQAARHELRMGVVAISGTRIVESTNTELCLSGAISGVVAFDHEKSLLRFDMCIPVNVQAEPMDISEAAHEGALDIQDWNSGKLAVEQHCLRSIRSHDFFASHIAIGNSETSLTIHPKDAAWDAKVRSASMVFDLRSAGLIDMLEVRNQQGLIKETQIEESLFDSFRLSIDSVIDQRVSRQVLNLEKSESGITKIEWPFHTLTINTREGHTPVLYRGGAGPITVESKTEWSEINGTYVPTKILLEECDEYDESCVKIDMELNWLNVNEEVANSYFELDELISNVGDNTGVFDARELPIRFLGPVRDGKVKSLIEDDTAKWPMLRVLIFLVPVVFLIGALLLSRIRNSVQQASS